MKIVLFDFDGTVADSMNSLLVIFKKIAADKKYNVAFLENVDEMRECTNREFFERLRVPEHEIRSLVQLAQQDLFKTVQALNFFEGLDVVLIYLKAQGYKLGIVSSSEERTVNAFLRRNNLSVFDKIVCDVPTQQKHKIFEEIMEEYLAKPSDTLYIGDEIRDILASHQVGMKCIAVTWGFNSRNALNRNMADYICSTPKELIELIDKWAANPQIMATL